MLARNFSPGRRRYIRKSTAVRIYGIFSSPSENTDLCSYIRSRGLIRRVPIAMLLVTSDWELDVVLRSLAWVKEDICRWLV